MHKQHKLFGLKDAYQFLAMSDGHFCRLVKEYDIPFSKVSKGRIFFEEDLNILKKAQSTKEEPKFSSLSEQCHVLGFRAAGKFVGVSHSRFFVLIKNYDIPFQKTSCGKVFFEEDLRGFMESEERVGKMKHART